MRRGVACGGGAGRVACCICLAAFPVHPDCVTRSNNCRRRAARAAELNQELQIEVATLRSPMRIDALARKQLGLTVPVPGQVAPAEAPSDAVLARRARRRPPGPRSSRSRSRLHGMEWPARRAVACCAGKRTIESMSVGRSPWSSASRVSAGWSLWVPGVSVDGGDAGPPELPAAFPLQRISGKSRAPAGADVPKSIQARNDLRPQRAGAGSEHADGILFR